LPVAGNGQEMKMMLAEAVKEVVDKRLTKVGAVKVEDLPDLSNEWLSSAEELLA
jgi:hypothetical protein